MTPDTDRFQQSLDLGYRVALAMPVSLFEVPSMYDSPRRAERKPEPSSVKIASGLDSARCPALLSNAMPARLRFAQGLT